MATDETTDTTLALRIRGERGDQDAETVLFRKFAPRVRLYGLRHLRDEALADDLVQQVLVVVIESLRAGRVREPEHLASFVLGTCRMIALDLKRGDARRRRLLEQYGAPTDGGQDPVAEPDIARLHACLEKLPTRERAIAILTFYAEQSGDQIARELSMTPGNVRVVRHRAVAHLQECMGLGDGEVT